LFQGALALRAFWGRLRLAATASCLGLFEYHDIAYHLDPMDTTEQQVNKQRTVGLQGLWGYEQLDRAGFSTPLLIFLVLSASELLHLAIYWLDYSSGTHNIETTQQSSFLILLAFGLITGFALLLVILLLRFVQFNFEDNLGAFDVLISLRTRLKPRISIYVSCSILWMVFVFLFFNYLFMSASPPVDVYASVGGMLFIFLVLPLSGLANGMVLAAMVHIFNYMTEVARRVPLELVSIDRYNVFSLPAVFVFSITSFFLTTIGVLAIFQGEAYKDIALTLALVVFTIGALIVGLFIYPVWLMRNRINVAITGERRYLQSLLTDGQEGRKHVSAIAAQRLAAQHDPLIQLMFINSLNEWPIGPHIQKVALFGVVPPVAWIMAAVVENILY